MAENKKKTVGTMPPTLLVGLGGTGSEIVGNVYELANEEQKRFIQFAFLDTDANELRERKFKAPAAHTVQTSRKITVGQALRNDPEAYENTFPINPQLMSKPLTEGAGQIRAVSKLAFDMCVREGGLSELHEAINKLQKLTGDDMEQSIRVLIVSTLVGGTGSGILLPVAMYLRKYLEEQCNKKPIIRAFCILPDVFFTDSSKTEVEKSNLRTNAYATLRELDAFMLRADSKRDSEIRKRFTLKMPVPGSVDQYDEYDQNPLDYCFLFDAQNIDGKTLDDLESYKRHAADCIYASSVSRLHKRLNSSEDNTILERCAENGRNRYCSAGTSKLIYPFASVRDYIALNWMSQAMTEDWLRYDNKVENEKIKRQKRRAKGIVQAPIDEREIYCNFVESDYDQQNYFGFAITEECFNLDKSGTTFTDPRWQSFYSELKKEIAEISEDAVNTEAISYKMSFLRGELDKKKVNNFKSHFVSIAQMMKILFLQTRKNAESKASIVADGFFSVDNFDASNPQRLEHWLMKNGVPLHPNSIRYFLYKLEKELREDLRRLKTYSEEQESQDSGDDLLDAAEDVGEFDSLQPLSQIEKAISEFFSVPDYPLDEDNSNRSVNIIQHVNSLRVKKKTAFVEYATKVLRDCESYLENVVSYYKTYLIVAVLEEAIQFIDNLSKNYEFFYKMLAGEIKSLSFRIDRIEQNYRNVPGAPVIYVCSSKNCLNAMLKDCPNVIDSVQLTEEFRASIFESIYKNADADSDLKSKQQKQMIESLVSDKILDFWRESLLEQYSRKVDMDIVQAIVKEAEYEEGITAVNEQKRYVDTKYREALTLSAPFIDNPTGQQLYKIIACGMSSAVEDKTDLAKSSILELFGHYEKDSLMDKYQILVMTALYNLRASDLKKFAAQDLHPADYRNDGSYFKDYVTRIDGILPDPEKSNVITPHLDRRWHFLDVMPDFEDKTDDARRAEAQKAFLIALAYGYVRFNRDQYKFVDVNGDFISEQIVVQDGLCDQLHEVYDALRISRPLVGDFLQRFEETTRMEKSEKGVGNKDFTASLLYQKLNSMHLFKYDFIPVVSYPEIPLLYKTSVGNGSFNDDDAIQMLRNFMSTTEQYLGKFYRDKIQRTEYFVQWLDEQTQRMLDNVTTYYAQTEHLIMQDPFHDQLFARIVNNLLGKFDNLSAGCEEARKCYEKYTRVWAELTKH